VDPSQDPIIRQLREQVSDNDRALIEAINARLRLVAKLKSYKESRGIAFIDRNGARTLRAMTPVRTWGWAWRHERGGSCA
jgi:chorismate mutase